MQESDAIGLHITTKFWNYCNTTTSPSLGKLNYSIINFKTYDNLTLSVFKLGWNLGNSSTSGCLTSQLEIILVLQMWWCWWCNYWNWFWSGRLRCSFLDWSYLWSDWYNRLLQTWHQLNILHWLINVDP